VAHCHLEGDNLDAAYPKPDDDPSGSKLTETNLRALATGYAAAGYRRTIYVNTYAVAEPAMILRAPVSSGTLSTVSAARGVP
jgi:hypothetical protein